MINHKHPVVWPKNQRNESDILSFNAGTVWKEGVIIKKASLTVEAAIMFPIFFFSVIALLYIIIWFQNAEKVQQELVNRARLMACVAYSAEDDKSDIHIEKSYRVGISVPILSLIPVRTHQKVYMRRFTGVNSLDDGENSDIVYMTPHGRVYHISKTCTYIKSQIYTVSHADIEYKRNANGQNYISCSKCMKENKDTVYITEYGVRYHSDRSCNYIEKNVIPIRYNEVKDRRICSKCAKERVDHLP